MSGLESILGSNTNDNKSGVSKEWDFEKTNKRIADFAVRCENADKAIIALYEAWSGEVTDYKAEYPRDFKITDVSDGLADAQSALELGFESISYKQEVLKKVLAAYMPNLAPEVYDAILGEIKEVAERSMQDAAYGVGYDTEYGEGTEELPESDRGESGQRDEPAGGSKGSL